MYKQRNDANSTNDFLIHSYLNNTNKFNEKYSFDFQDNYNKVITVSFTIAGVLFLILLCMLANY